MTSVFTPNGHHQSHHQRTNSQGQQLLPILSNDDLQGGEEEEAHHNASPTGYCTQLPPSTTSAAVAANTFNSHDSEDESHPYRHQTTTTTSSSGGGGPQRPLQPEVNVMRFSALSDCSSYYGLPGTHTEHETRFLCRNPYLRANKGVVLGAVALTFVGAALLLFGLCVTFLPNDMDVHGWVFLVVGVLFFIPGAYHITYITCVLFRRPGYSFDNLPTFSKPI